MEAIIAFSYFLLNFIKMLFNSKKRVFKSVMEYYFLKVGLPTGNMWSKNERELLD